MRSRCLKKRGEERRDCESLVLYEPTKLSCFVGVVKMLCSLITQLVLVRFKILPDQMLLLFVFECVCVLACD